VEVAQGTKRHVVPQPGTRNNLASLNLNEEDADEILVEGPVAYADLQRVDVHHAADIYYKTDAAVVANLDNESRCLHAKHSVDKYLQQKIADNDSINSHRSLHRTLQTIA